MIMMIVVVVIITIIIAVNKGRQEETFESVIDVFWYRMW